MLKGICAISENNTIGNKGKIPRHKPGDLKRFKELVQGQIVVMGRGTFESLKQYRPNNEGYPYAKKNIVLSHNLKGNEQYEVIPNTEMFLKKYENELVRVLGGGKIFKELLPYIDELYLTIIQGNYEGDTKFPENYKEYFPHSVIEKGDDEGTHYETYYKFDSDEIGDVK